MKSFPAYLESRDRSEESKFYAPVVFTIMAAGLVYLFRHFLFTGKMLYGTDTVTAGIFHRTFLIEHFKQFGEIPQWNPYAYCGMPYVDAIHGDIFYPLSVLKFFMPLHFYMGFNLVLHIFLAGVFMYLAARQFKLGKTASLFAAASYMFAPFLVSMVAPGHDGKIYTTAIFPLVVLFLERAFEARPFLNFTIVGTILGVIILTPQPETSYFTFWVAGMFTLFKLFNLWQRDRQLATLLKPGLFAIYAVIIALLLSAIQFYPSYVYSTESSARANQQGSWDWATSWSMHEEEVVSQLIPEFCGTTFPRLPPLDTEPYQSSYWGKNSFKDNSDSIGAVAIFLSFFGLFFSARKQKYFFAVLALLTTIYALGATTPIFEFFYNVVPKVKLIRSPSKILFIFSFSISLLAGMGIQAIIDRHKTATYEGRKKMKILLIGFPTCLFVLAVLFTYVGKDLLAIWTSTFPDTGVNQAIKGELTKYDLAIRGLPEIQRGAWFAFLFTGLAGTTIWIFQSRKPGPVLLAGLVLLPVIDGSRFNSRFIHAVDAKKYFEPNKLVEFFKAQQGHYRVLTLSRETSKSYLPQFGIEVVQGYHGNQLRSYDELLGGLRFKNRLKPRFLNLVGARYIVIPADARTREDYFGELPARPVAFTDKDQIVQNDNAFPRVYLVNRYRVFHNRHEIPRAIIDGSDDLRQLAYLEKMPPLTIPPDSLDDDSAWIINHALDSVIIGVHCRFNRLLLLTENYFDCWHVYIDGKMAELLRAYGTFRAVAVPAGAREVKFVYQPKRYAMGKIITEITSLYLLAIFGCYIWNTWSNPHNKAKVVRPTGR